MPCQCCRMTKINLQSIIFRCQGKTLKYMSQYIHIVVTTFNECQMIVVTRLEHVNQPLFNRLKTSGRDLEQPPHNMNATLLQHFYNVELAL